TLVRAIYEAALAECLELGYGRMTMEGVAARARTGKAALYRRWGSKQELLLESMETLLFESLEAPHTGSLRGDLLAILTGMADTIAGRRGAPGSAPSPVEPCSPRPGRASPGLRHEAPGGISAASDPGWGAAAQRATGAGAPVMLLIGELLRSPELIAALRTRVIEPRLALIQEAFRRAARRGEIPSAPATPLVALVAPAMVIQHYLLRGAAPPDDELLAIVDQIVLPLLRAGGPASP
ncbi:MAG TPA: TetR/AcrR family transcriptional regulator, partial [Chloroflexota bacterium]|nr:TetR/AcrR family transcriptional regulator [Chloroflexota bacterium]